MKDHFHKLLTERQRNGPRTKYHRANLRIDEDSCTKEGMKKHFDTYSEERSFTDVLNPLVGYLRKNVGRKWDDVFSEISKHMDRGNTVQRHLYEHLWQFVEKNVVMVGGVPCYAHIRYWFTDKPEITSWRGDRFYIHPETGILCKARNVPLKVKRKQNYSMITVGSETYYKHNNIWWRVVLEPLKIEKQKIRYESHNNPEIFWFRTKEVVVSKDILIRSSVVSDYDNMYGRRVACIRKSTANKKEIKLINEQIRKLNENN